MDPVTVMVSTTVAGLQDGDVIIGSFPDEPTVKAIQVLGPMTIIDMADGTATAPVPTNAGVNVRRTLQDEGDWECFGCGFHVPALTEGFNTKCPACGSYELHLSDEAKARMA